MPTDIRDASGASFGRVESLGARAGVFEIAAITFVALGSLMTIVSLFTLARGARRRKTVGERVLPAWRVAHSADRELAAVARESQAQGWTDELIDRALSAMRVIAAASLVGGTVSQSKAGAKRRRRRRTDRLGRTGAAGSDHPGPPATARRCRALITAHDLRHELARLPETASPARRAPARDARRRAGARSPRPDTGRRAKRDGTALDEALSAATARQPQAAHRAPLVAPAGERRTRGGHAVERQA